MNRPTQGEFINCYNANSPTEFEMFMYLKALEKYCDELESKLNTQTICGYPMDEAIRILESLTLEHKHGIEMTLDNLGEWMKILMDDIKKNQERAMQTIIDNMAEVRNDR